jgi:MFS family permease
VKAELGLSNEQFGWVLGAFSLAYALFEIPSGVLGDRIGTPRSFYPDCIILVFIHCFNRYGKYIAPIATVRFLFGVGESGTYPNILIVMSRWFPVQEMGRSVNLGGYRFTNRCSYRTLLS